MDKDFATTFVEDYEHREEDFAREKTQLLNGLAAAFAHLMQSAGEAKEWRKRLEQIGWKDPVVEREIGYIPKQTGWVRSWLERKGYSPRFLDEVSFVRMSMNLAGDAVLPVRDSNGDVVSFAVLDARLFAVGYTADESENVATDVPF